MVVLITAVLVWLRIIFTGNFGDERENFVAGWFIFKGLVPYRDFFFHHAPLPFFIASVGYFFSSQPWQLFRWFVFSWWLITGIVTLVLIQPKLRVAVALIWLIYAISVPLFHLHFLLAESIALPPLLASTLLLYSFWKYKKPHTRTVLTYWIFGSWVAVWSTIIAAPPFGMSIIE